MNRNIVTAQDLGPSPADMHLGAEPRGADTRRPSVAYPRADSFVDKLLKLIPAEVVAVWVTVRGILAAAQSAPEWLQWISFGAILALTPIYLQRVAGVTKPAQVWVTTGAFIVWAYSLGGVPFGSMGAPLYLPIYGAVLLPIYTFAIPVILFK